MQLNEKELKTRESLLDTSYNDLGLAYTDIEIPHCALLAKRYIDLRESCIDLAEFKRKMLNVETDEEVTELRSAFNKFANMLGYIQHFEIVED